MEGQLIQWLRQTLPAHPLLRVGPGDDAAVLALVDRQECVVTADMLMQGVHFELAGVDPRRIGHKALAVNLSDLAAMASRPLAAVVSLALPRRGGLALAKALYAGMLPLAERYGVAIAGGDTNSWDGPLVVNVVAIGATTEHGLWRRDGARPGDQIVVSGSLGGSRLGRHLDFEPRIDEALRLAERYTVHAAIDLSDGLGADLPRVMAESGCGAELHLEHIPISNAARELAENERDGPAPLDHAISDGEDFELLLAVPPEEAARMIAEQPLDVPLTVIGRFVGEQGLWQVDADGSRRPLKVRGYEHELDG